MSTHDLVAAQSVRNVAEAIERALIAGGHGARVEETLWPAIRSCGVDRAIFDQAIDVLLTMQRAWREGTRLYAGAQP